MEKELIPVVARQIWSSDEINLSGIPKNLPEEQRIESVRDNLKKAIILSGRLDLVEGELLYEVVKGGYYKDWGYVTFDDYIEKELTFKRGKAYELMRIYQKFVIEIGMAKEGLKDLQWSKARYLVKIVDKANYQRILEETKDMTVSQVKAYANSKNEPENKNIEEKFEKMFFMLAPEQFNNVNLALELVSRATKSEKRGHLLDLICTEFLNSKLAEGDAGAEDILEHFKSTWLDSAKRVYGIEVQPVNVDTDVIPALNEMDNKSDKEELVVESEKTEVIDE